MLTPSEARKHATQSRAIDHKQQELSAIKAVDVDSLPILVASELPDEIELRTAEIEELCERLPQGDATCFLNMMNNPSLTY